MIPIFTFCLRGIRRSILRLSPALPRDSESLFAPDIDNGPVSSFDSTRNPSKFEANEIAAIVFNPQNNYPLVHILCPKTCENEPIITLNCVRASDRPKLGVARVRWVANCTGRLHAAA